MKNLIISPHTDDAIFSLGDLISTMEDVTILSIFSGIPFDEAGHRKHKLLREEHDEACKIMGVKHIELDFLDDVYARTADSDIGNVVDEYLPKYDVVFVPLGIHHPDHIQISDIFIENFKVDFFYRDLPYATLYPEITKELEEQLDPIRKMKHLQFRTEKKIQAVNAYESQIQNDHILQEIFVPEVIYQKI